LAEASAWEYIDEVIVLDLSSEKNRAEFFELNPSNQLDQAIQRVISKASAVYSTRRTDDD
jgi:hypothetical protein